MVDSGIPELYSPDAKVIKVQYPFFYISVIGLIYRIRAVSRILLSFNALSITAIQNVDRFTIKSGDCIGTGTSRLARPAQIHAGSQQIWRFDEVAPQITRVGPRIVVDAPDE
jgi:hypothetical protein